MNKLFLLAAFLVCTFGFTQSNLISIDTVISIKDTPKDVLLSRMHLYITKNIKSKAHKNNVLKEKDEEKGVIKASFNHPHKSKFLVGTALINRDIEYQYEVYFKDNKIRLVVESFNHSYFGTATDETSIPSDRKIRTKKDWLAKVWSEYISEVKKLSIKLIDDAKYFANKKDKSEGKW